MASKLSQSDIENIDKQLEQLFDCKPISEAEIKSLCEKVYSFKLLI
jgi:hypothetical protein